MSHRPASTNTSKIEHNRPGGLGLSLAKMVHVRAKLVTTSRFVSDSHNRNRTAKTNVSVMTDGGLDAPAHPAPGPRPGDVTAQKRGLRVLARHRQSLILQAVRSDGSARVSDLTQQLGVSDMTVRRDLEALARDGLIEKVHGGAVLPGAPSSHEPGFEAKSGRELPEKGMIARAAASLVTPRAAVALSAGTTTYALAQQLVSVPGLTVVTNSVRVAGLFEDAKTGEQGAATTSVVLTGGLRTPSEALVGPIADLAIRSLHFDLLFLGCHGVDPEAGLTTPNLAESETNPA